MRIPDYSATFARHPLSEPEDQFIKEEQHRASMQELRSRQRDRKEAQRLREFKLRSSVWDKTFKALRDRKAPQSEYDEELAKINSDPKNKSDIEHYFGSKYRPLAGAPGEALSTTRSHILDDPGDIEFLLKEGLIDSQKAQSLRERIKEGPITVTSETKGDEVVGVDFKEESGKNKIQTFNQRINNAEGLADMINEKKDTLDSRLSDITPLDAQANTANILNRVFDDYRYEFDSIKDFKKSTKNKPLKTKYPVYIGNDRFFATEEEAEAATKSGSIKQGDSILIGEKRYTVD